MNVVHRGFHAVRPSMLSSFQETGVPLTLRKSKMASICRLSDWSRQERTYVPGIYVPRTYVLRYPCSPVPMFPGIYVDHNLHSKK